MPPSSLREVVVGNIIWIIIIGFVAGLIARVLSPGPNEPLLPALSPPF
jgi:hypothetical protein